MITVGGIVAGTWLIVSGIRKLGWVSRFKMYKRTLGESTHCTLERLARSVGKNVKFVRRELQKMINKGLFLEGHMDREETCLITSDRPTSIMSRAVWLWKSVSGRKPATTPFPGRKVRRKSPGWSCLSAVSLSGRRRIRRWSPT